MHEPLIWGGRWHAQYARPEQPFVLELGCGKGGFISQLACAHPENNYLGIDITDKVLILAKRKIEAAYQDVYKRQGHYGLFPLRRPPRRL